MHRLALPAGIIGMFVGLLIIAFTPVDDPAVNVSNTQGNYTEASLTEREPNYLGWAVFVLSAAVAASGFYFKNVEKRRADRAEAREIHDRKLRGDDVQ